MMADGEDGGLYPSSRPGRPSLDDLLNEIETSVMLLENEARANNRCTNRGAGAVEAWTFFDKEKEGKDEENRNRRCTKRRVKPKSERGSQVVAVGTYTPNFDVVKRRAPAFRFHRAPHASPVTVRKPRTRLPSKRERERWRRELLNPKQRTDEDLNKALKASSRVRSHGGWSMNPKSPRHEKKVSPTSKIEQGPGFKYNYSKSMNSGPAYSFSRPKELEQVKPRKVQHVSGPPLYNIDEAYKSTQANVRAVAWVAPENTAAQERSTGDDERSYDVESAWKATLPNAQRALAWVKPSMKPEQDEQLTGETKETRYGEPIQAHVSIPILRKQSHPTVQLQRHEQRKRIEASKRGPGTYANFTNQTTDPVLVNMNTKPHKKRKTVTSKPIIRAAVGYYEVDIAVLDKVRPRQRGPVTFAKSSKEPKPERSSEPETNQPEPKGKDDSSERYFEAKYDQSSSSSSSSSYEGKSDSDFDEDTTSTAESKWESDTTISSEDSIAKQMESWFKFRKRARERNRANRLDGTLESNDKVHHKGQPSSWGRPSHEESARGQQYIALREHKRRKAEEQQGPKRLYATNNWQILEPRRDVGIVSMQVAERTAAKQREINERIRQRMELQRGGHETRLFHRLGIDPSLLDGEDDSGNPSTDFENNLGAPQEMRPSSMFVQPVEIPHRIRTLLEQRKKESEKLGPGTYTHQLHQTWMEHDPRHVAALQELSDAKARLSGTEDPVAKEEAKRDMENALKRIKDLQKEHQMGRTKGRERVRVLRRGIEIVEEFGAQPGKDAEALGPGEYEIPAHLTRHGAFEVRGTLAFGEPPGNAEDDRDLEASQILILDPTAAIDAIKPRPPGARGIKFSQLPRNRDDGASDSNQEKKLDLEPNFEYGKYHEPGKHLVPFHKQVGRSTFQEFESSGGDELMLEPERGEAYLRPAIRNVPKFDAAPPRGLDREAEKTTDPEPVYSPKFGLVRERKDKGVLRYDKMEQRWPDSPEKDRPHEAADAEYETERALDLLKPKVPVLVDMDKQFTHVDTETMPYVDAVYETVDPSVLGGRDTKGRQRRAVNKSGMSMDKQLERWEPPLQQDDSKTLILDPANAETATSRSKPVKSGVLMELQLPRWKKSGRESQRHRASSPVSELVEKARNHLSIHDRPRNFVDMSKQSGRESKFEDTASDILDIDPLKAREAPSLNKRVTGGTLSRSKRGGSPSTKYAKELAAQGNVLELDPRDSVLRPRIQGGLDMAKQSEKGDDLPSEDQTIIMDQPEFTDLNVASNALKPQVHGGHSALRPKHTSKVLQEKERKEKANDASFKREYDENVKRQHLARKIEQLHQLNELKDKQVQSKTRKKARRKSEKANSNPETRTVPPPLPGKGATLRR